MSIVYREGLGRPLTWQELDGNFREVEGITQSTADDIKRAVASDIAAAQNAASDAQSSANQAAASAGVVGPQVRESLRRSYAEAGFNLVNGSFELGGVLVNPNDVLLQSTTGKAFRWGGSIPQGGKIVPPGSTPSGTITTSVDAWVDVSGSVLASKVTFSFKSEGGKSAIENMISGRIGGIDNSIERKEGNYYSTGGTVWKCNADGASSISEFTPIGAVSFLDYGAIPDDATDCISAIVTARSAGFKVLFDGKFYASGVNVRIDGFPIGMTEGSYLRMDTDPGNYSKCEFYTDFRIKNSRFNTDITLPGNNVDLTNISLSAGSAYLSDESLEAISFTKTENTNITGYNTRSAFSGVIVDDLTMAWQTPSSVESGFFTDVETGLMYEATFLLLNSITTGSAFVSVLTTTDRYFFDFKLGNTDVKYSKISSAGSGTVIRSFQTDRNANLAIASNGGGITSSVRITSHNEFELYVNDIFISREKVSGYIQQAGFTSNGSGEVQISKPIKYLRKTPKGSRSLNVLCIGDSQTYGVGSSKTWPDYLKVLAGNAHGLGDINVENIAVSGTGAKYWDDKVIDYSKYDYVMMMVGTNDVQGLTPINSYGNYIQNIITDIKNQGATPIVGIFPLWTTKSNSGSGDPLAKNNQLAARYRSELKSRCSITGAMTANPLGYLGNNMSRMSDNIHPDNSGCISIASAFVAALSTVAGPRRATLNSVVHHPKLFGGWQNDTGIYPPLTYCKDSSGVVTITGSIRNGGDLFETFATLPEGYRPAKNMVFPCVMNGKFGTMWVESNGNMQFMTGDTTDLCSIHATFFAG